MEKNKNVRTNQASAKGLVSETRKNNQGKHILLEKWLSILILQFHLVYDFRCFFEIM